MLSVRLAVQPKHFYLYYDILPSTSDHWVCACTLAKCVQKASRRRIFGQPIRFPQHKSDLMRIDLLDMHGGMYLDHDTFVLRALDRVQGTRRALHVLLPSRTRRGGCAVKPTHELQ